MKESNKKSNIFITVGTQLPFPRIFTYLEQWLSTGEQKNIHITAQTGTNNPYVKFDITAKSFDAVEYEALFENADVIISHAGMGTILNSMIYNKPLIIVPRKTSLNEHRNDHQIDTAKKFENQKNIFVAHNQEAFTRYLDSSLLLMKGREKHKIQQKPAPSELSKNINIWLSENEF